MHVDLVRIIEKHPERRSELNFRAGVVILLVLAAVLVLISLGIVRLS